MSNLPHNIVAGAPIDLHSLERRFISHAPHREITCGCGSLLMEENSFGILNDANLVGVSGTLQLVFRCDDCDEETSIQFEIRA